MVNGLMKIEDNLGNIAISAIVLDSGCIYTFQGRKFAVLPLVFAADGTYFRISNKKCLCAFPQSVFSLT